MTNLFQDWASRQRQLSEANKANGRTIFDALMALGITQVTVRFDGCGDSGQIEDISTDGAGTLSGEVVFIDAVWGGSTISENRPLDEAIENLCYALLECAHDGWEINDGAFGTFEFDVAARKINLDFNARYVDYTTTIHSFGEA